MRGLDNWIGRGHERDDAPARYQCAEHGYQADDYPCDRCDLGPAEAINALLAATSRALTRIKRQEQDAAGLAERDWSQR